MASDAEAVAATAATAEMSRVWVQLHAWNFADSGAAAMRLRDVSRRWVVNERFDEVHEHRDGRVYEMLMNRTQGVDISAQVASLSALMRVWYENGQMRCEGEIVPPKSETADDD